MSATMVLKDGKIRESRQLCVCLVLQLFRFFLSPPKSCTCSDWFVVVVVLLQNQARIRASRFIVVKDALVES